MAVHNTDSDAANTAGRSLLTSIGKYYWGSTFNTGSGSGKKVWEEIRDDIFEGGLRLLRSPHRRTARWPCHQAHRRQWRKLHLGIDVGGFIAVVSGG